MKFLMKFLTKDLLEVAGQGLMWAWRKFGKPALDNPKTPEDESDIFDPVVEAGIDALVDLAVREAKKRGVPVTPMDVAKDIVKKWPSVSLKDAYAKVTKKLRGAK